MSNLWKEIKDNVKEWSTAAIKKADEVSKLAIEKTGDFTKISKIKLDIRQTQKDIDNVFEDLGRYVYLQVKEKNVASFKTNIEFDDTIKKVDGFKAKIKTFEKEIDNIKKEVEKAEVVKKPKASIKTKTQTKKTTKPSAKK
ncbi:hypothetical protein KKF86_05700 [bacterium]|nr:hypothetical protein [bacterium]